MSKFQIHNISTTMTKIFRALGQILFSANEMERDYYH